MSGTPTVQQRAVRAREAARPKKQRRKWNIQPVRLAAADRVAYTPGQRPAPAAPATAGERRRPTAAPGPIELSDEKTVQTLATPDSFGAPMARLSPSPTGHGYGPPPPRAAPPTAASAATAAAAAISGAAAVSGGARATRAWAAVVALPFLR